jgi:hypothetical protein
MDLIKKLIISTKCDWIEMVSEITLLQAICQALKLSMGRICIPDYFTPGTNVLSDQIFIGQLW